MLQKASKQTGFLLGSNFTVKAVKLLLQAAQFKTMRNYVGGHMGGM